MSAALSHNLDALLAECAATPSMALFRGALGRIRPADWPRAYVRLRRMLDPNARDAAPLARAKLMTLEEEWLSRAGGG